MWGYIARRLLWMIPTMLGVTLLCFALLRMADVDPVATAGHDAHGVRMSAEALQHLRRTYDLDQPWHVQYGRLVRRLLTLDLGTRWLDGRPIREVIGEALPVTLLLSGLSLGLAYLVAIPIGVVSATRPGSLLDRGLSQVLFALYSLPSYWVGALLLTFLATGTFVRCEGQPGGGCFPLQGLHAFEGFSEMTLLQQLRDVAWHLVLPLTTLTYNAFAALSRHTRSSMLAALQEDYVRTARAKGLPERTVVMGHALRNSLLPLVTLLGLSLPQVVGGAVIVEWIFGIRGMGLLALEAVRLPDYPLVITLVAITALLTSLGMLLADVLVALLDPRIRIMPGRN